MSDDTMPAAPTAPEPATGLDAPGETTSPTPADAGRSAEGATTSRTPEARGDASGAPRKRRRRGSRGGRNRNKSAATAGTGGGARRDAKGDDGDEAADRGLTSDDVAADAKDEAGLSTSASPKVDGGASKPKIGDRRPAPAVQPSGEDGDGATKSRRRRRGGRGRSRGGNGASTRAQSSEVVRADLGFDDAGRTSLDDLDDEALERRRGRTRKGLPTGRYTMCVHARPNGTTHIAILEGRSLVEHSVSSPSDATTSIDGNIYLGKVQNVLPGMEAAFIDIGTPKNGVLYRGDVAFDKADVEESQPKIETMLKNGQMIVVQVTKNPIGAKGARLTQEVSLAGRFVVMVPGQPDTYGISKRLPDEERKRLRRLLEGLRPPDAGLIVRTAAEGATPDELERDVKRLRAQWEQISALAASSNAAKLLYQEPPMVVRVIREEFTKEYRAVVIDDRELYEQVKSYVDAIAPELADRIEFHDVVEEQLPLYERFHVHEQLHKALDRKVWLPSGGSLIIERTEALTVIDVNTGKNVGKSNLEETVFRNNLEAADEIARQLRLRDVGGIIVIDFIDMEIRENRDQVLQAFKDALARDKTRTQVFDISELGLVEMTRKRISEGLVESFSESCPTCQGRGFRLDQSMFEDVE